MGLSQAVDDTTVSGADLQAPARDVPLLVRLHTGNFSYFLDVLAEGIDVRFMAGDDITPLKFHFERFDPINQMALAWVKFPLLNAASKNDKGWIYYGNAEAVASQDAAGTYEN